jgi:hypothetical protein
MHETKLKNFSVPSLPFKLQRNAESCHSALHNNRDSSVKVRFALRCDNAFINVDLHQNFLKVI